MKFYTSDLHFGHENVIKYDGRPFSSVEKMNKEMIRRWNDRVRSTDEVYILGDFSLHNTKLAKEIVKQLHGKKYLIRGNHDEKDMKDLFDDMWDYKKIKDNGRTLILSHYFIPSYDGAHRGYIMLHGHSHNTRVARAEEEIKEMYREKNIPCEAYNAGCMYFNYAPATLDEIIAFWENNKPDFSEDNNYR